MKKEDSILLLIYVVIGLVTAGVTGWFLYQDRLGFWQTQARSTFHVALQEELQKWKSIDVYCHLSGNIRLLEDVVNSKKEPIKVTLRNEAGKKDFWIPYEKYIHNIEQSSDDLRGVHSYLLHISPLNADSLNIVWKNRLAELGFFGKTAIRISVSDWQEHETYTYSTDSFYLSKSDSLTVSYIGCRCEVGVTGYLYDSWWMIFSGRDITWLVALIAFCIFLFFMQNYVYRICCRLFVKQKSIVVEKEVSVVVCHKSYSHIYQLEEGVYFDIDLRMLKRGNDSVKLMPLSAKLLEGFLNAEDYRLSNAEILHLLWPDGTGTLDRLHQNIKRLRDCLSQVSSCILVNESFAYRLKIPHFIEENSL